MRLIMHFGLVEAGTAQADSDAISLASLRFLNDSGYGWDRLSWAEKSFWQSMVGEEW